jgi:hypothetical protein
VAGHFEVENIVVILQKHFYWPKLQHDTYQYIRLCIVCSITKSFITNVLLHIHLSELDKSWESISMDYMSGFPSKKFGHNCVFVVINRFCKMTILAPYKKIITAEATTKLFFVHVWVHFGIPQTIILGMYNRFIITFWSSLWSLMDTKLTKSISFHPQIDVKIEVVNMMIVHILRMYNSKNPCTWDESLPYV